MIKRIHFDYGMAKNYLDEHELEYIEPQIYLAHDLLHQKKGPGHDQLGWLDWPLNYDLEEFRRIKAAASKIKEKAEVFIVIGIGGSYLGARAALGLLTHTFYNQLPLSKRKTPEIYFAGFNISPAYLNHLLDIVENKDIAINIVSKSGTTLEPSLALRVFRQLLEKRYGKGGAKERIFVTTGKEKSALKDLALREGYEVFQIPNDIGGRYSVLTAVGLLPVAVSGIDIDEIMEGAREGYLLYNSKKLKDNISYQYAAIRNLLYRKGKIIELLVSYEPHFYYFTEWWKQLFGESEGKDNKGIFPAGVNFSTDLHSLGQLIQDGQRNIFATNLWVEKPFEDIQVPPEKESMDGLDYLAGSTFHLINEKVCQGTMSAHAFGMVPSLKISIPEKTPFFFGQLVYFFEKACAISGYLLGVNPFDQPGIEAYKKQVLALLGNEQNGNDNQQGS